MEGWIKIHRKILDNPIVCKDSDYLSVWIYLLANATHKEIPALFKGQKIMLQPGQLITGRKSIANHFNISESKVKRILIELESDQQIDRKRSNKNSLISILNWEQYQKDDQQNGQQMTNNRPATDHKQECKNIYLYLYNIYKGKLEGKTFGEKIHIINQCMQTKEYMEELDKAEKDRLFTELMKIK